MKWIVYFGLLLCSGILMIVACVSPGTVPAQLPQEGGQEPPIPTNTPTPESPPEYLIYSTGSGLTFRYTVTQASMITNDSKKRIIGCKTIVPFDGRKAFDRYPGNHWLLWTFTVNFDLMSKAGKPLGCLRLYRRNFDPGTFDRGTFELIERGNILVDTCRLHSETINGATPGVTFNSGSAIFDGTDYITCAMNLSDWIERLSSRINLTVTQPGVGVADGTETFTSTHTYENFTIAASIVPTARAIDKLLPLVYYMPNAFNTAQPALVLKSHKLPPLQLFGVGCNEIFEDPDEQLWWYDLRGETNEKPEAYVQYAINFLNEPADRSKYQAACSKPYVGPLEFSLEEATLYIGYEPRTKQIFTGTINGILVDPTDSKPEKS